ncbi:MAG TPA: hypothetical protein VF017_03730 [Thermoanaerobaculia bacterium]|nr:hypothetical protein [Thermoanaerobaculia bacterium]
MEFIAPMAIAITTMLVIGATIRSSIINRRLRENARAQADLQAKLIDKFGSAEEVIRYLESTQGKALLEAPALSQRPHARILDSVHLGLLIVLGGAGMLATSGVADRQVADVFRTFGLIAILLGVGFLCSAAVSWFLMRQWGLLPKAANDSTSEPG